MYCRVHQLPVPSTEDRRSNKENRDASLPSQKLHHDIRIQHIKSNGLCRLEPIVVISRLVRKYLKYGDPHQGFARVRSRGRWFRTLLARGAGKFPYKIDKFNQGGGYDAAEGVDVEKQPG